MDLTIEILASHDVALLRCRGRITCGEEAELLCNRLHSIFPQFSKCILSLAGISQMDAQGLGVLMDCLARARGMEGVLMLANVPPRIQGLLRITRLSGVLDIYPSEEDAMQACCQAA